MAVAKRQGRSKDQSEDFRQNKQNKQHSWLSPICIGQAQMEEKTYKRRSQRAFSQTLSPACMHALSLSLSLSLFLPLSLSLFLPLSFSLPTHSSTLFSSSLGFSCYLINKNGAVTLICLRAVARFVQDPRAVTRRGL